MTNDQLLSAGQTDVGQYRKDNQDAFVCAPLWSANDALLVVIDGVGGYAGGAEAAALAKESIVQYMTAPTGDTLTMLREAVVYANNQIVRQRQQNPALARMCCVLTVAVADVEAQKLLFVHVGDTRLYRFRNGQLEKLTHDHSLVGVREDANQLTEREAMSHPRRNEILRDVGSMPHRIDDPEFLESGETDFLPGDGVLLCSDGLTDMLTKAQITAVLTRPVSTEKQITELIRQANEHGGHDNITVVLARFPVDTVVARSDSSLPATGVAPINSVSSPEQPPSEPMRPLEPADAAPIARSGVTGTTIEKTKSRTAPLTWLGGLMVFIVIVLVAGIAWWQPRQRTDPPPVPATVAQPVPALRDSIRSISADSLRSVPVDSLTELTLKKQPDSLKKP